MGERLMLKSMYNYFMLYVNKKIIFKGKAILTGISWARMLKKFKRILVK